MKIFLAVLLICLTFREILCIYNFVPEKAPELSFDPGFFTATLDYRRNRTHHEMDFNVDLLQDLRRYFVTLTLLDYTNYDVVYCNYTYNPCLKNAQNLPCEIIFKDMTSFGNLTTECPAKKGNRSLSNFVIDMIKVPSILPLNLKLRFQVIVSTVRTLNRFNKIVPILTVKFLGKIASI